MKIIHYCAHAGGFVYEWHRYHMISELEAAGHQVIDINPVEILGRIGSPDEYSEITVDKVREIYDRAGCDLFFATATDETIRPGAIKEIGRKGIATLNLSCDDLSHPFRVRAISSSFDLTWTTVRENQHILRSYGANVFAMPWGANPHVFKPADVKEDSVVGFVGSCYGARARNLAVLANAGLPVRVYGQPPTGIYGAAPVNHPLVRALYNVGDAWSRVYQSLFFSSGRRCLLGSLKRSVVETFTTPPEKAIPANRIEYLPGPSFQELGTRFSQLAISLGSIELSSTYSLKKPLLFIRLREFEVPMCGGVHLANRLPELGEYFEEDKEMLFYGDLEELIDKARYYLAPERDHQRQKIREHARKRALAEHTWLHRFGRAWQFMGLAT